MDSWTRLQVETYKKIERAYQNFKKSPKERITVSYVETRIEILEKQWLTFEEIDRKLITEYKREEYEKSAYHLSDICNQTEDLYTEYKTILKESLRKVTPNKNAVTDDCDEYGKQSQSGVKLPRIAIPSFSGHYSQWTTFRDLFQSLIHNNHSLDNVQKLHYLKSYLTGEAEQLLRHLPVTNDNYVTCWNILVHRFNNKKFITDSILKRFFSQKQITTESSNCLKELYDTTNECMNALTNEGINIEHWDLIVIYILSSKLDQESRKQWEAKVCSLDNELPTLKQFLEFVEHRFRSLEFLCTNKTIKITSSRSHHVVNNVKGSKTSSCSYCFNTEHKIGNCNNFASLELTARRNFVQTSGLCYNCLGAHHAVKSCRLPTRCKICSKKHHSLLHTGTNHQSTVNKAEQAVDNGNVVVTATTSQDESKVSKITSCFSNIESEAILATALVNAQTSLGSNMTMRCLVDQGSQASFITESATQLLGLKKFHCNSVIQGVGGETNMALKSKHVVYVKLHSFQDPAFSVNVKAYVLSKLTSVLPGRKIINKYQWPKLQTDKLADPQFNIPNKIDILLGSIVYSQIICEGLIKGPPGTPIAQETKFGWIISGEVGGDSVTNFAQMGNAIIAMHTNIYNDDFNIKQFWELESDNFELIKKQYTPEEKRCEDIYNKTTKRDKEGRYIVKLPFIDSDPKCKYGNSREIAMKKFSALERRFLKSPELRTKYAEVISEYINLGHIEEVPENEVNNAEAVYLPYHEVVREDKTTTKFRVVFNASSRDKNGVSLNSDLLVGPRLQSELRHILMRWRLYPICLVADIVKMYRQIKVTKQDTDYQRILWRADSNDNIKHLRLLRVTFGTASAPYLAVRTLHQVAHDEGNEFPVASEKILQDFYVDDLITGCDTVSEGKQLVTEITMVLNKGGFDLQKWSTNNQQLYQEISKENTGKESNIDLKENDLTKILGLTWNRRTDEFEYSVQLPPISEPVTKRKVISDIAKLFDPMGWLSPAIITAKIMIQKLWLTGIDWDEKLPPKLLKEWTNYRAELAELTKFKLPRWIHVIKSEDSILELHGFSDASNAAYAAAVYLRVVDNLGNVWVHLITSKTRVAPIKQVSTPRLELCGAVLLAKLLREVAQILNIPKINIHAWTDSMVVLAWLSSHPTRWKTFIANRVSEILNILDRDQWSHVSSSDNPADCASRGISPLELISLQAWKTGPAWLTDSSINYDKKQIPEIKLEEKMQKAFHVYATQNTQLELWTKFSSLRKLVRIVAYCKRFISKLKGQNLNLPVWLTGTELNEALNICVKQCQEMNFLQEIDDIRGKKTVNKKSKIKSLNPFLDDAGILRVGGRLENADIRNDVKHPIILPSKSHFTDLVLAETHVKTLHGGPQLMLNYLRSKYWVIDAKNRVKLVIKKCIVCVKQAAQTQDQLMGQLPLARVNPIRAFYRSGVDYAGPIQIRTSKGRGHRSYKGYICLFVCMATRAIHLEAVSDLTSQGFLAAFKRFVARRGHCADLFSDNGTNFVGAARELRDLFVQEKSSLTTEIAEVLANNGTTWHFIPPHAPHFGGLWEAGVKSTKHHLKRVVGNSTLTFEELSTLLYQVEACLNSRPLSQISTNPDDPIPLTPGHFLVGEPLTLVPEINYENSSMSSLKRWQLTQKMLQDFWRRWSREYLTHFLHRYKWADQTPEPEIGDVVLVKEDDLPPAKWLLGKIIAKHPGLDNITRVVTLKSKNVCIKRPVTKICVLPVAK